MLRITTLDNDFWDETNERYLSAKSLTLTLEHSLVSVRKWEAKHHKPFLTKTDKTEDEILSYVKCMTVTPNADTVDPLVYMSLGSDNIRLINDYIADPMTATTFAKREKKFTSREVITSEVIYYQMTVLNIPIELCEKWHLNSLLTLINVCDLKNQPAKKMSPKDIMANNKALNEARLRQLKTSG